jgi:hypothetical protein
MTNFSDLISYFESIARKHVHIRHTDQEKHFFRMEIDEVLAGINRTDVSYPMLILEGYSYNFTDNRSDNILKNREGAFILMGYVNDITDYNAIHEQWDFMESIADDILAKIKADKRNPKTPVIRSFDLGSVKVTLIMNEIGNNVGLRIRYDITSPQPLEVNPEMWIEEETSSAS